MKKLLLHFLFASSFFSNAQNLLNIPPALTGTSFNLSVQNGTTQFFSGINTPTYGVNGALLGPSIVVNEGDMITLNVTNNLSTTTTMHWHGLHVPAMADGGPHQIINPGDTWSPVFEMKNKAGTYWYHPHGEGKTDFQVSKGLAGFFIVHDAEEAALNLPSQYGVDDIPLVLQTKAFDVLHQVAIATNDDSTVLANGIRNAYCNLPAQVIRLRLLNGNSMRTWNIGLSDNSPFHMIANDAGLLDSSQIRSRVRVAPGGRRDILLTLNGREGDTLYLMNYGSELQPGIYGAADESAGTGVLMDYADNPLNGNDFSVLKIIVDSATAGAVTTVPDALVAQDILSATDAARSRTFYLEADSVYPFGMVEGPFNINGHKFSMDSIGDTTYMGDIEIWEWINHTDAAHPIHIHDVSFNILDVNGIPPTAAEKGKKDVVMIMPGDSVRLIMQFKDYADMHTPYMYHCHLLHHEDDGMMGSFLVIDSAMSSSISVAGEENDLFNVMPNPSNGFLTFHQSSQTEEPIEINVRSLQGVIVSSFILANGNRQINVSHLENGLYLLEIIIDEKKQMGKLVLNH